MLFQTVFSSGAGTSLICYPICYLYCAQLGSVAQSCPTLCDPMDCSPPGLPVHHWLLELTQLRSTESVMPSNQLILCHLAHNMLSVSGWWGCFDARNAVFSFLVTPPSRDIDWLIQSTYMYWVQNICWTWERFPVALYCYVLQKSPDLVVYCRIFIYLFILFTFGCTWSSLPFRLSSSCGEPGLFSSCRARVSPCSADFLPTARGLLPAVRTFSLKCAAFSLQWLLLCRAWFLGRMGSEVVAPGSRAQTR